MGPSRSTHTLWQKVIPSPLPRLPTAGRWLLLPGPAGRRLPRRREALAPAHRSPLRVAPPPAPAAWPSHLLGGLPALRCESTRLAACFPLRCFQRFSLPDIATEPAGRPTTPPPAVRPARSSRTRASPAQCSTRSERIETELSHDVLNPARVPLSWANSPTLGTYSSPRMRRADIEVPRSAVDMNSWAV